MTRSHSSKAATSQTSTVQTVLRLQCQQRPGGPQGRVVVRQLVSGAAGIAVGDVVPVVEAAAEAVGPSKRTKQKSVR